MPMKRTSLFLDDGIMAEVRRLAKRRGVSVATVVREALAAYVAEPTDKKRLPSITGRFISGKRNTASRVDQFLWQEPHK